MLSKFWWEINSTIVPFLKKGFFINAVLVPNRQGNMNMFNIRGLSGQGMSDQLLSGPGSVVEDGLDIHIPGIPVTEDDRKRKPCRVIVTLIGVYYGGDDVGSEWRYEISVNGGSWVSDLRIVHWRTWDSVDHRVYDEVLEYGCGMTQLVKFLVRARERDWFIFDDIGKSFDLTALPCLKEKSRRQVVILVPVEEYPSGVWRWLLRSHTRTALMHFVFEVEAQCVE